MISGVGESVQGYNMFAYCFNNPVNMGDPSGNWPKFLKEIGSRFVNAVKTVARIVTSPLKAVKGDMGLGIGLGAQGSANIQGVNIEAGLSTSITDSLEYDKGRFDIKNTT